MTGPGLPTGDGTNNGAWYTFKNDGGSPLVEYGLPDKLRFKDDGGAVKAWSQWTYEGDRDLVASIAGTFGNDSSTDVISKYEYVNDARGPSAAARQDA
ncbi:MAG: hypothetical protein HZB38_01300 [Planctomycetes bacterium]|nr:hypothetical protein [Planctomycetota bacterium]